jgi:hypothetical protein
MKGTNSTRLFSKARCNLRQRWRLAGYEVSSLLGSMKALFSELESDARDRIADARQALTDEILASACPDVYEVRNVSEGDSPNISR